MKYVVLARLKETNEILEEFGVYKYLENANNMKNSLPTGGYYEDIYYCVEEIDPLGSFANREPED